VGERVVPFRNGTMELLPSNGNGSPTDLQRGWQVIVSVASGVELHGRVAQTPTHAKLYLQKEEEVWTADGHQRLSPSD
jgi:hypothetical protein